LLHYVQSLHLHIDLLINNGAVVIRKLGTAYEYEDILNSVMVNIFGPQYLTVEVLKLWKQCKVINICSQAAIEVFSEHSIYAASKAALRQFTFCLQSDGFDTIVLNPDKTKTDVNPDGGRDPQEVAKVLVKYLQGLIALKPYEDLNVWEHITKRAVSAKKACTY
ncbi:MAG: SDR family NAD(P)-dependent oxidoreductase, partial [bacterium]|nr:SDR family NAD(P)-dependent oxidoreductase [bacterium]